MPNVPKNSHELGSVLSRADELAEKSGRRTSSAHVLLALFTVPNPAQAYLREHEIDDDRLLERLSKVDDDPPGSIDMILERAQKLAIGVRDDSVTSLHLLAALSGFKDSSGYRMMRQAGVTMSTIRTEALSMVINGDLPVRFRVKANGSAKPKRDRTRQKTIDERGRQGLGIHPGLAKRANELNKRRTTTEPKPTQSAAKPASTAKKPSSSQAELARRLFGNSAGKPKVKKKTSEASVKTPAPKPLAKAKLAPLPVPRARKAGKDPGDKFELSPKDFPTLTRFGRNLTAEAARGRIDPVVGRDLEIGRLSDILNKRRSNNPVLVGPAGVGKTAVVEGLAHLIVADGAPGLSGRVVIELEAGRVFGGTGLRGSLAERLVALRDEVESADGQVVVFLDEIHRWIGGASSDNSPDGVEELKPALARGTFPCIGATTDTEYGQSFENDPAFARRFQVVRVDEPSIEETTQILQGVKADYSAHHSVEFSDGALAAAARLSHRYLLDRRNPDKSLAVLDLCGSRARRKELDAVDETLVAEVVAEMSGVPASKLLMSDRERFLQMEDHLMSNIVGHERNLSRIAHVLRRNYAGFSSGRPIGSFLLLGPTGVGKTETAKALADFLFHDREALTVVDMSEFGEAQSVARLIGAPPGYVGHESGGQLTESVRKRPYQIVVLDEIEKCHPSVQHLMLQVLEEARLTDSRGRLADFSSAVVVMTSNLGAAEATSTRANVGFGRQGEAEDQRESKVKDAARRSLEPELWNRIDEVLVFEQLTRPQLERIAHLKLHQSSRRLLDEKGIAYACAPAVVDFLLNNGGFEPDLGARPLRRALERYVEGPIADLILRGDVAAPAEIQVGVEDGELVFDVS